MMHENMKTGFHAKGFLLAAVIWLLAAISLGASFFAGWIYSSVDLNYELNSAIESEIDLVSTKSTLIYLLASRRMTLAGLTSVREREKEYDELADIENAQSVMPVGNEIALDNRTYAGIGDILFSLQDERGLLNINYSSTAYWLKFLSGQGAELGQAEKMMAKLADYIDKDSLYRVDGAEDRQYKRAGLELPANRKLISPMELRRVFGWSRSELDIEDRVLLENTSTSVNAAVNVNTAPRAVLMAIHGMTEEGAEKIIQARRTSAIKGSSELARISGVDALNDDENLAILPSRTISVTLWRRNSAARKRYQIELTPYAHTGAPWATLSTATFINNIKPEYDNNPELIETNTYTKALFSKRG